jgi:aminoglycoside phosphotransferase (APT) family kinase protein
VYALSLAGNQSELVLRVAPDPGMQLLDYEYQLMRSEMKIHQMVRDTTDIPVPNIIAHDFSQQVIERDYMLLEHFSGQPLSLVRDKLPMEAQQGIDRELGKYTARIHEITADTFGYAGSKRQQAADWHSAFGKMLGELLSDGDKLGTKLPVPPVEILAFYQSVKSSFEQVEVPVLVHWDLWDPNIFVVQENDTWRVEGIIDWERAFWGDPEAEIFMLMKQPNDAFFKTYGKPLATDKDARIRQTFYRIHLWLVMLIEASVRFEDVKHLEYAGSSLNRDWQNIISSQGVNWAIDPEPDGIHGAAGSPGTEAESQPHKVSRSLLPEQ